MFRGKSLLVRMSEDRERDKRSERKNRTEKTLRVQPLYHIVSDKLITLSFNRDKFKCTNFIKALQTCIERSMAYVDIDRKCLVTSVYATFVERTLTDEITSFNIMEISEFQKSESKFRIHLEILYFCVFVVNNLKQPFQLTTLEKAF